MNDTRPDLTDQLQNPEARLELLDDSYSYYSGDFARIADGPQLEGLSEEEWAIALADPNSLIFDGVINGKRMLVPVITPIKNVNWYNGQFFRDNDKKLGEAYHFCAPPSLITSLDPDRLANIREGINVLAQQGASIVFDHKSDNEEVPNAVNELLIQSSVKANEIMLGDKKGEPSSEIHFEVTSGDSRLGVDNKKVDIQETYARMVAERLVDPSGSIKLMGQEDMTDENLKRLWSIYEVQFGDLTKDDPLRGALTEKEFYEMLLDPKSISITAQERGKIVSLCHMVTDLSLCGWLNADYYAKRYPDKLENKLVWFFPGIVSDAESKGAIYSIKIMMHLVKLVKYAGISPVIEFECTDRSSKYVPWLVLRAINMAKVSDINIKETSRYHYRALKLSR